MNPQERCQRIRKRKRKKERRHDLRFANFVSKKPKLFYMGKMGFIKKNIKRIVNAIFGKYHTNTVQTAKWKRRERRKKKKTGERGRGRAGGGGSGLKVFPASRPRPKDCQKLLHRPTHASFPRKKKILPTPGPKKGKKECLKKKNANANLTLQQQKWRGKRLCVRGIKRSPDKMEKKNVLRNDSFGCISSPFVKGEKEEKILGEVEFRMKLCNQNGKRREDVDCGTSKRRNKVYSLVSPSTSTSKFLLF